MLRFLRNLRIDLSESIQIAFEQLQVHKARSALSALGVIIGVWAVILIGVFINGLDQGVQNSLNMLGGDLLYVEKQPWREVGDDWRRYRNRPNLELRYADQLNEIIAQSPNSGLVVAVPVLGSRRNIRAEDRSATGIQLQGTNSDFNYINTADIEVGRFFTFSEAASGQNVVILGYGVAEALFPGGVDTAIDQTVRIADIRYRVIGVFDEQGSFLGMHNFDNIAVMPLASMRRFQSASHRWVQISIRVMKRPEVSTADARDEIIGAMRRVRGLMPTEENDFEVNASDTVEDRIGPLKSGVALAGFGITSLSLFVGAIGIMNITFVSVKERTKEIGTRRAIGARRGSILIQFLTESVSVCLLGGVIGLGLAFLSRLALAHFLPDFPASLSTLLIFVAAAVSIGTGVLAGFVPALMASRLDPATALRHE